MIVDSKSAESHNPFRDGMNAEVSLDSPSHHQFAAGATTTSSPQISFSEASGGPNNSAPTAPSYAPPAYPHGEESFGRMAMTNASGPGPGPGQPNRTPLIPTGSNAVPGYPYAILPANISPGELFSRPAPQQPYPPFNPTFLIATGQYLTRGFPAVPPPSREVPHPFASHDVTESDWLRFLQEVKAAGELTDKQEQWARLPIVSILPIVGSVSTHIIRQQMKKGKSKDVANVINTWNHHFFHPRHMEVVLMHGMTRLSGMDKHPTSHTQSTPGWSGSSTMPPAAGDSNKDKGKAKEEEDTTFRLFIMPLYTHTTT